MSADPWEHRASNMHCGNCMWFVVKSPRPETKPSPALPDRHLGRCRRHAPTIAGYPAVFTDDWCGDHKLDENKI